MAASDDGETVDAFLERIASLKIKRDREDEERTRKLEEEILQGRRERQARRAGEASYLVFTQVELKIGPTLLTRTIERARSLSPPKESMTTSNSSFANCPTNSTLSQTIQPPVDLRPSPQPKPSFLEAPMDSGSPIARDHVTSELSRQMPRNASPTRSTQNNAAGLSRSSTLSWQQRPSSRDSNSSRARPLSGLSTEFAPPRAPESSDPERIEKFSRTEIAQSLASKDPTWFRQTADRGTGSAAFRRNQEDPTRDTMSAGDKLRLPGMSREPTAEPEQSPLPDAERQRAVSPEQDSSGQGAGRPNDRFKPSHSTPTATRSPVPLFSSQRLMPSESDIQDEASERPIEVAPSQSKSPSDRPPSPTKGLGGFVQSAMMKRSDSVNKRWSTQAASGLRRGDSIAGQRGTLGTLAPVPLTRGGSPPRETSPSLGPSLSPSTYSRPSSSHSTTTVSQRPFVASQHDTPQPVHATASSKLDLDSTGVAEKPEKATEPRLQASGDGARSTNSHEDLPLSPSKTMDPKRWSPTKASWLESALSKPDSSKITSSKVEQPTWRSDLQKSKQSKLDSSENRSSTPSFDIVTQSGLMRSPPPGGHSRPLSVGGLPEGFSSGPVKKPPVIQQKPLFIQEDSSRDPAPPNDNSIIEPTTATETAESGDEPSSLAKREPVSDTRAAKTDVSTTADQLDNSTWKQKAPALKPKPHTPPKTDFRANLKSRQKDSQDSASAEPEFKNVFGKLRRTETKNYVAPDVLKTNILTGKAALNLTGGPQKVKRTDDFKESILSQKEAMKAGGGSINKKTEIGRDSSAATRKPAAGIPEALTKKNQLFQAASVAAAPVDTRSSVQASISSKPAIKLAVDPHKKHLAPKESVTVQVSEKKPGQLEPSKAVTKAPFLTSDRQRSVASTQSADVDPSNKAASGNVANRMNPSLASILMRGPPSNTNSRNQSAEDLSASISNSAPPPSGGSQDLGDGHLTHITKGRAKGPKRRLPKTEIESKEADKAEPIVTPKSPEVRKVSSPRPQPVGLDGAAPTSSASLSSSASSPISRPLAMLVNQNEKIKPSVTKPSPKRDLKLAADPGTAEKPKPTVAAKSPDLRKVSSPKAQPTGLEDIDSSTASDAMGRTSPLTTRISSPGKRVIERGQTQGPAPSSEDTKSDHTRDEPRLRFGSKPQLPQKPTSGPASQLNGHGVELGDSKQIMANISKPKPPPPEANPVDKRTVVGESRRAQTKAHTTVKESAFTAAAGPAAGQMLQDLFDEYPKASDKAEIDAHAVVSSHSSSAEKTKTVRMQIWEVNGDGKRQDMPPQQEHILYEESIYLCVHSVENAKGSKNTEAFLWCGDNVGEAAVEDAQLFCRKIARENGAKLELLKQGKETPSFIQALGGIIITRRSKSSSLYMLCGRRHLGHVSFDEVDIDANNLCSGFPYLISARFGKLYLWKGKGSGADEVGCARLIGMDLGLTGEIEEVTEDDEPPNFWEAALGMKAGVARSKWSEHWSLKGTPDQYRCRLFRIELGHPKPAASFWTRRGSSPAKGTKTGLVQEITPFCQKDLETSHIFVLDAYFEIYVYIGTQASSKSVEFVTALFFAQEYSILTASLQDRPLVPPCHITTSEPPPDFRAVFRKWTPGNSPGKRLNTIPLNTAVEALA